MRGLRGAVGCAGGCQRRRDTAGGCWWFYVAQIHVQTPPGPAQRARFARPPWLDGCGQAAAAERWLGQKGLLCSMPLVVPRGTRLGPMAVGWPMASLGATRTSPTLLAVSVPDASAVSAVSRAVGWGCGAGWGAQWPVLVVVGGVLAADRPTQGYLSARVTASTSAAPAVSACGQRQRRPQRAAPMRAQPAGAGGRGDRRCGRYEPLRQVCGRKLRVGAAPARAAEGAPAARRSGRRCRRRRLEPAIAGGPAGLARGRLGLRKIGFRGCKGANKTLYGCSDWA